MIPLLAGVDAGEIRGPLSGLNALCANNDSQLHQLLSDVAKQLGMPVQRAESYLNHLSTLRDKAAHIKSLSHIVASGQAPEETTKHFSVSLTIAGSPPSAQMLRVRASQVVRPVRSEYLLSTGVCVATDDNLSWEGETFDIPIDDQHVRKLWNTPRADKYSYDHSGPAKLRLTLSVGGRESSFTLPIQMDSYFYQSTMYRKLVGSEVFQ